MAYDVSPIVINYDDVAVFDGLSGNQPIPYVTKSNETINYRNLWWQASTYRIDGQITGNGPLLWGNKNSIIEGFQKDFRKFSVEEGESKYVEVTGVIRNINFNENKYYGILDYSITIETYEAGLFKGTYGVLNPVDQISYSNTDKNTIEITHEISAKGFQSKDQTDGSNALQNAKDFVFSRRDSWKTKAKPIFASGEVDFEEVDPIIVSSSETIDRFEGIYSLTDTFVFSATGTDAVIESRSVTIESGIAEEVITATVNGEIYAGKSGSLTTSRDHFKTIDLHGVVNKNCPEGVSFYHVPINLDVKEDPDSNTINYSASYDNLNIFEDSTLSGVGAYYDYTVTINRDAMTDIANVSIGGTVKGRGNAIHRRKNIETFYEDHMVNSPDNGLSGYLYAKMKADYDGIMGTARVPNPYPASISVSSGNVNGEIQVSAEFTDEDYVEGFLSADYSVSVQAAMPIKTVNASARFEENGYYMLGDMDVGTREKTDITVNMTYDREFYAKNVVGENEADGTYINNETLSSMLTDLGSTYTPLTKSNNTLVDSNDANKVRLETESYNENRDSRSVTANYSYTFNGSKFPDTDNSDNTFMRDKKGRTWLSNKYFDVRSKG